MGKVNYLKDKKTGQLAGSRPDPVSPSVPPSLPPTLTGESAKEETSPGLGATYERYSQKKAKDRPEWVKAAPFSTLNAIQDDDYVLLSDYEIGESEFTTGDRLRRALVKKEKVDLFLRAEEVERKESAPGLWTSVVRYPTYMSEDGSCVATQIRRGDFGSSQSNGIVTADGNFVDDPQAFSQVFSERLGEPGCPLYDEVEGYPDDWQIRTVTGQDHAVQGLHIVATCEEVDVDPDDLIDSDSAWDSRFD